jgi:DNA-binding XRE family transcriptional regulator
MGGMTADGEQGVEKNRFLYILEVMMTSRCRDQGVLGRRLWDLRLRASLSRRKLAQRTGVSRHLIESLEQGRTANPKLSTLLALAGGLGVRPAELVEGLSPGSAD